MAKSLDSSSISVVTASGGNVYSPFDCSTGPEDNNNNSVPGGYDGGQDDSDLSNWWDCL